MSYNLKLETTTIAGVVPFLDSAHIRWIRGAVTLDSATIKTLADAETTDAAEKTEDGRYIAKAGAVIGKLETGKFTVHNEGNVEPGGDDSGEEDTESNVVPVAILHEDVDVTDGDAVATAIDHARVIVERLPVEPNAYVKASLPQITWV